VDVHWVLRVLAWVLLLAGVLLLQMLLRVLLLGMLRMLRLDGVGRWWVEGEEGI
jgi:hypothetical protein